MNSQFSTIINIKLLDLRELKYHLFIPIMHHTFQLCNFVITAVDTIFKLGNLVNSAVHHVLHLFDVGSLVFVLFFNVVFVTFDCEFASFDTVTVFHRFCKLNVQILDDMLLTVKFLLNCFELLRELFNLCILVVLCVMEIFV